MQGLCYSTRNGKSGEFLQKLNKESSRALVIACLPVVGAQLRQGLDRRRRIGQVWAMTMRIPAAALLLTASRVLETFSSEDRLLP